MRTGVKRDRRTEKGLDKEKLVRIWKVLQEAGDWLHIAEIARRSGLNEVTVRWYLDHYLSQATEEQKIVPGIRLRMVKLIPGMDLARYLQVINTIKQIKAR